MLKKKTAWLSLLVAFGLVAAACGDDDNGDGATGDTTEAPGGDATGEEIFISGSSTVEPISVRVAELIEDQGIRVSVDGPGTGDGFELFCNGETDISDASRPIKGEEAEACEANGIEFVEIKVAFDGIAVMTNTANDAVECLSFADMYALVGPESEGFDNWSDAQELATELGSTTELPDAELVITAPGEESGTYDTFVELVIEEFNEDRGQDAVSRPDYSSQADDSQIVTGIEGADTSFGWVGFGIAEASNVKILEVDGGDGCVQATAETIADGSYPLSRALYIYVNVDRAEANPDLATYVDFYLTEGYSAVEEVGYISLPDDQLQEAIDRWEARETGSFDGGS